MLFQGLYHKVTRARPTSNMMFSAAAIAVVSEVNPDEPGAFLFPSRRQVIAFLTAFFILTASAAPLPPTAMASAIYNNTLIPITPMLFHHIELGMRYETVLDTIGKSALYCDSGESVCNANKGLISEACLKSEFIRANKTWVCHWDGIRSNQNSHSSLDIWFVGVRVAQVAALMPNGSVYRRDSDNTIQLERHNFNITN